MSVAAEVRREIVEVREWPHAKYKGASKNETDEDIL